MKLTVTFADGRAEEVGLTPGDIVRFERHFNLSWEGVEASPRMDHVMFLAWTALRRLGKEDRDYEQFLDDVADFDSEGEAAPLPPPNG